LCQYFNISVSLSSSEYARYTVIKFTGKDMQIGKEKSERSSNNAEVPLARYKYTSYLQ
jgi:hypothetical protein